MPVFNTGSGDIINLDAQVIGTNGDPQRTSVYAVPNAATQIVADVINATWNAGIASKIDFQDSIVAAKAVIDALLANPGTSHIVAGSVSDISVTAPNVTIPTNIDTSSIIATFDAEQLALITQLQTKYLDFRNTYFPNEQATYAAAESWLQAAIADPSGLPANVRAQLLSDAEAPIIADKLRAQDAVLSQFAARRFALPPDVAASAALQIEQKAQDAIAEAGRKITVLSVEQLRFVVKELTGLRGVAMDGMAKYIATLSTAPDTASKVVGIGYDAQSKLISAASDFYRADASAKEIVSKVAQYNNSLTLEAASKNQAADLTLIEAKIRAMLAEAQAVAQMTTALFNNVHTGATISSNGGTLSTMSPTF